MEWPIPQKLRQHGDSDCSVPVFAALAGISEEELLRDLPDAPKAKINVEEWEQWLRTKGKRATRSLGQEYALRCAHLVEFAGMLHWIYRDDTGVHDPNPAFQYVSANHPEMLKLSYYSKIVLTISIG